MKLFPGCYHKSTSQINSLTLVSTSSIYTNAWWHKHFRNWTRANILIMHITYGDIHSTSVTWYNKRTCDFNFEKVIHNLRTTIKAKELWVEYHIKQHHLLRRTEQHRSSFKWTSLTYLGFFFFSKVILDIKGLADFFWCLPFNHICNSLACHIK